MSTPYATQSDVVSVYGQPFVDNYTTDLVQHGITDGLTQALAEAHDTMLTYLLHRYSEEDLRGLNWVIRREAKLAGYYLSLRRGQSPTAGIQQAYVNVMEDLESMASDTRRIIPGAKTQHQPGPQISNFRMNSQYLVNRQRRVTADSTSTHSGARDDIYDRRAVSED